MRAKPLQTDFSSAYAEAAYHREAREQKAAKVLAILQDCLGNLAHLTLLDVGCSTGFMSRVYAERFAHVLATDVDAPALRFAWEHNTSPRLDYLTMDAQHICLPTGSVDAVTCTHIYEHVPDARQLLDEIHRVLKPGGYCFFSAGNRLSWMEPHYRLPLLSVLPKPWAHLYLRALGRGMHYYETHLTYWGLRRLVQRFALIDYTRAVVEQPDRFAAGDVIRAGSVKQAIAIILLRWLYWACPTYLWVLRKPTGEER